MTPPDPLDEERRRRLRERNRAVFWALIGFVVLVYAITMVKIKLGHGLM